MVSFTVLLSALTAISSVLAIPLDTQEVNFDDASVNSTETERIEAMFELMRRQSTPNSSGTNNGYFYSFWSDGASPVTYTNGAGGSYSMEWKSGGNVVAGKGWNPGGPRSISYQGTWSPVNNGNAVSCVLGAWCPNFLFGLLIDSDLFSVPLCIRMDQKSIGRILHPRELWGIQSFLGCSIQGHSHV